MAVGVGFVEEPTAQVEHAHMECMMHAAHAGLVRSHEVMKSRQTQSKNPPLADGIPSVFVFGSCRDENQQFWRID